MTEMDLLNQVRLKIQELGCHSFRTNVGKVRLPDGRYFDTGLPKGHADLYGYRKDGRCFYIETKIHPNKPSVEQVRFLLTAIENNCCAGVAYSVEDALNIIKWDDGYALKTEYDLRGYLNGKVG